MIGFVYFFKHSTLALMEARGEKILITEPFLFGLEDGEITILSYVYLVTLFPRCRYGLIY